MSQVKINKYAKGNYNKKVDADSDLSSKMKNMMKELIEYGYSDYDKNKNQLNIHGSVSKVLDIFDP